MPKLKLPTFVIRAVKRLAKIDEEKFTALLRSLKIGELTLSIDEISERVAKESHASPEDATAVIHLLLSLDSARVTHAISQDELLRDINTEFDSLVKDEVFSREVADVGFERITQLIRADSPLHLISKAINVLSEHEHVFRTTRIVSDIRPIFSDDLDLVAATIVHSLKLEFTNGHERAEMFLALDDIDLQKLGDVVARAKAKSQRLQTFLNQTDISFIATAE